MPTPCHALEVTSTEDDNGVALNVAVEASDDACAQVVTPKTFVYTVEGGELVNPVAMIGEEKVELNLFEKESVEEVDLSRFETKG